MVIKFKDLESKIPEKVYIQAEQLLDKNAIQDFRKAERNLYLYKITDNNNNYEVEILATKTQSKSYSCDCKANKICEHICCALIQQRSYFEAQKQKAKKKKADSKTKYDKLSIDAIFDNIEAQDLKAFIKNYAKGNTKFALALQVNFARRVTLSDNRNKYKYLVEKMLKPLRGNSRYYTIPSVNLFIKNSKELIEQYKDAVSLKSFVEATTIVTLLLNKAAYALSHLKLPHEKLEEFFISLHKEIGLLLQLDLAPELRDQLMEEIFSTIQLSYYPVDNFHKNLAQLILKYGKKKEIILLSQALKERIQITKSDLQKANINSLRLLAQQKKTIDPDIINNLRTQHLQQVFKNIFSTEDFDLLTRMSRTFRKTKHLEDFAYDDINILLARRSDNNHLLAKSLTDKYLRTRDQHIIKDLLKFDLEVSEIYLRKIFHAISSMPAYAKITMSILHKLEEYNLLIDYTIRYEQYKHISPFVNDIADYNENLIELYIRKYIDKSHLDPMVSHRNHIYMVNNANSIFNDKLSMFALNKLKTFKEALIEETMS